MLLRMLSWKDCPHVPYKRRTVRHFKYKGVRMGKRTGTGGGRVGEIGERKRERDQTDRESYILRSANI